MTNAFDIRCELERLSGQAADLAQEMLEVARRCDRYATNEVSRAANEMLALSDVLRNAAARIEN